jgi:alkanesulfonate monooxygenase SsuD/methylene tetrahydromethanopterin reductase-like flavin-dependent oxidoreductase (luciferase family)
MTEMAGRIGDGVLLFQGASPELIEPAIRRVAAAARGAGRDTPPRVAAWAVLGVGAERALARRHVRGRVAAIAKISNPDAFDGPDREAVLRIQEGYKYLDHASAEAAHADMVTDGLIDRFALAGNPQEVRVRLDRLLAMDELSDVILSPQVSGAQGSFEQTLRTFAADVVNDVL